jgi:hypothetical protein
MKNLFEDALADNVLKDRVNKVRQTWDTEFKDIPHDDQLSLWLSLCAQQSCLLALRIATDHPGSSPQQFTHMMHIVDQLPDAFQRCIVKGMATTLASMGK